MISRKCAVKTWTPLVAVASLLFFVAIAARAAGGDVTSFGQLYSLSNEEASEGRHFIYEGVVLCYDRDWNQLFLAEGPDGKYIGAQTVHFQTEPKEGDYVRLTGVSAADKDKPFLTNINLTVIGTKAVPKPKRISLADLAGTMGEWIEVEAEVRIADSGVGKLELAFYESGEKCTAFVMGPGEADTGSLVGAKVRLRGVNTSSVENGRLASRSIIVPGTNELTVVSPPRTKLVDLPVKSIGELREMPVGDWTNEVVRINGWIEEYRPGEYLVLRDPTGLIRADLAQTTPAELGERADVWGFATGGVDGMRLNEACFALQNLPGIQAAGPGIAETSVPPASNGLKTITAAAALRILTPEQSGQTLPGPAARRHHLRRSSME